MGGDEKHTVQVQLSAQAGRRQGHEFRTCSVAGRKGSVIPIGFPGAICLALAGANSFSAWPGYGITMCYHAYLPCGQACLMRTTWTLVQRQDRFWLWFCNRAWLSFMISISLLKIWWNSHFLLQIEVHSLTVIHAHARCIWTAFKCVQTTWLTTWYQFFSWKLGPKFDRQLDITQHVMYNFLAFSS